MNITTKTEEIIERYKKSLEYFNWLNKYSDYIKKYRCTDDCKQSGCPTHIATFSISHATDTYSIDWGKGEKSYFDNSQMALILQFAEKISDKNKDFIRTEFRKAMEELLGESKIKEGSYPILFMDDGVSFDFRGVEGYKIAVKELNSKIRKVQV